MADNTLFVEVSASGLPDVDGLFVPSRAPPARSESGTVSFFKSRGLCVEIDTSQDRQAVYALVVKHLAEHTRTFAARPHTERAEVLLGLRPYPKRV